MSEKTTQVLGSVTELCEVEIENKYSGKPLWSFALLVDIKANRFVKPTQMFIPSSYYAKLRYNVNRESYIYISKFGTKEGVVLQISLIRVKDDCGFEYRKTTSFLFKYPNTFNPRRAKCVFADSELVGDFVAWAGWDQKKLELLFSKQYSEKDVGNLLLLF
ncbi:hypothetical protein [Pyrobaculum sp.]|uniref:hypothetical protein n=1 Tax=Pyrobaculum sp. TaxID=2004705 RepID=UPI003D0FCBF1